MTVPQSPYAFRPVTLDDFPMIFEWREMPAVKKWFGEIDQKEARDDFEDRRIRMQIVSYEQVPFAWIQDYDPHGWPDHHFAFLPQGARAIDMFIGPPTMLGKGHGTAILTMLRDDLFAAGVPALGIDPDTENSAAYRLYQKIGFEGGQTASTQDGVVYLMSMKNPLRFEHAG